jgi:hypothetical protein
MTAAIASKLKMKLLLAENFIVPVSSDGEFEKSHSVGTRETLARGMPRPQRSRPKKALRPTARGQRAGKPGFQREKGKGP